MKKNILQIYKEFKDTLALWHSGILHLTLYLPILLYTFIQ